MKIPHEVSADVGRKFIDLAQDVAAAILCTLRAGWGYASQSPEINATTGELLITEHLRDGMRRALEDDRFPWGKTMIIPLGTESRSQPEVRLPDGRTDIPIFLIEIFLKFGEHDPHAIIECKRIAGTDTNLCRYYVIEGIDRFRTGKYAGNHALGFMVGYLLRSHATAAADGINRYLSTKARHSEHLLPSSLIRESWAWDSKHSRDAPSPPIQLYHAFFEI